MTYFINPTHLSVCLYAYLSCRLLGNGSINTFHHNQCTQQYVELTDTCFCGPTLYPLIVATKQLGKDVTAPTKNRWRSSLYTRSLCRKKRDYFVFPGMSCFLLAFSVTERQYMDSRASFAYVREMRFLSSTTSMT
jgi:hypothetical protein